jgi:hypothetical protein
MKMLMVFGVTFIGSMYGLAHWLQTAVVHMH